MADDHHPIGSQRIASADAVRHNFRAVKRGFDPQEVWAYLERLARELTAWEQRCEDLRMELADATLRADNPVVDEATLSSAFGQKSAQVLRNAHDEATRITEHAENAAAVIGREAQQHAAESQVRAEAAAAERIAEAELTLGALNLQVEQESAAIVAAAREEAEAILARARVLGQEMIDEAQENRRRILADMAQRRKAMTLQIEQFRSARDVLASAVTGLRTSVEEVIDDLVRSDDRARLAAAEVARVAGTGEEFLEIEPDPAPSKRANVERPKVVNGSTMTHPLPSRDEKGKDAGPAPRPVSSEITEPFVPITRIPGVPAHPDIELKTSVPEPILEEGTDDGVEDLFARLRAGSLEPEESSEASGAVDEPVAKSDPGSEATPGSEVSPTTGDAEGGLEPTEEEGMHSRRAELLDALVIQLARRIKRTLQDDQNRLLDRLRSGSGTWSVDVLPPEPDQRALYVEASVDTLRAAGAAGVVFAREMIEGGGPVAAMIEEQHVVAAAEGLSNTVVTQLRRHLADPDAGAGDMPGVDRIGAAYREWRGKRIERLAGDCAVEVFSLGVLSVGSPENGLRWVVGGESDPCADCDDNALAGSLSPGEPFPTGHRHPPAHSGCRCLVAPAPA